MNSPNSSRFLQKSLSVIYLSCVTSNLFSQPPAGGGPPTFPSGTPPAGAPGGPGGEPCWYAECVPIDGGLIFLLIGGALIGVSMLYRVRKSQS